ncbi:hypothetical protein [Dawidia cretensis]|nr:hypothetical protein [Dawidia cretensis]
MKWIKTNYIFIIIGVGTIATVDLLTRFWFWKELHLKFDSSNFNNIVTPIAAILSVWLFSYLAVKQYRLQLSSNLKQNLDREFDDLYKKMEESIEEKVLMAVGIRFNQTVNYSVTGMSSLNYFNELIKAFDRIFAD